MDKARYSGCLLTSVILFLFFRWTNGDLTFDLPEESPAGYLVGNVAAGMEFEGNPDIRFQFASILRPNETFFSLDNLLGELRTVKIIDRELQCPDQRADTYCQKTLQVLIRDGTSVNVINVYVNILDINDHTPSFSDNIINLAISESVSPGTQFPLELATDPDVGNNTIQSYRLSDDYDGLFELLVIQFPDGTIVNVQLKVTAGLDRELRPSYAFYLEASDNGVSRKVGSALLNVTVLDANDHSPKFLQGQYSVDIPEDWGVGNSILTVQATDDDTGSNGKVVYSFAPSVPSSARALFEIDRNSGTIKTIGKLDYETKQVFQLSIQATNDVTNPIPDFSFVTVNIIDVNDNKPVLTVTPLDGEGRQANLSELSPPGTHVAFITVSDIDTDLNGEVSVSLLFHFDNFTLVEERPGQYFVKTVSYLDREEISIFNITVMAQDHGNPARFTRKKLVVFVEDVNDNYPYFVSDHLHASIRENNELEDTVTTIVAFDDDDGMNSNIIFEMIGGEDLFFVNPITGVLRADVVFDREDISTSTFVVEACDQGVSVLCTNTTVTVDIVDENDNSPVFVQDLYEVELSENNKVSDLIGIVEALDPDSGSNAEISYTLKHPKFRISKFSGSIYAQEMLDYEEQRMHSFIVTATDGGSPGRTGETRVVVTLLDENDNSPRVVFPDDRDNVRFIPLDAEPGFPVAQIESYDPDDGRNAMLSFEIESGNIFGSFGIRSNGKVVTAKRFKDFEERVFNISIRVTDGGIQPLSKVATLHVAVADRAFNESLPPSNFTERFNRTIFNFHLVTLPPQDKLVVADWLMVIVISLAGLAIFLLIIFLLLASSRCRKTEKPKRQYSVPNSRDKLYVNSPARSTASDVQSKCSDIDSIHPSIATSHSSIPSKNIIKWRQQAQQHQAVGRESRNDLRLGNQKMSTFGSNSDIHTGSSASINSRRTPDPDQEVQRLLDKLRQTTSEITSDHSSEGDGRSSSHDSGNGGDSDRDTKDVSTSMIHGGSTTVPRGFTKQLGMPLADQDVSKRSTSMPMISSIGSNRKNSPDFQKGPRCTPECRSFGHSEQCWSSHNPQGVSKSKSVSFSPYPDEYEFKDRNDNRVDDRRSTPSYGVGRSEAAVLLNRIRQSPTTSYAESTNSDPGRYDRSYEDSRKPVNAANLSPIREHPDERRNRQRRHSNKRRTQGDRALHTRASRLTGSLGHSRDRPEDTETFSLHNRTPSTGSYEGGADSVSHSSVDSIKVRPPAPYLDVVDSDDEYSDHHVDKRCMENTDEMDGTYRDWV